MKSIFIVTDEQTETRGHEDFGKIKKLSTYGGYDEKQYPAFKSREEAQRSMALRAICAYVVVA